VEDRVRSVIETALAALSERRPVFHSEADFQHALAWIIREQNPSWSIRLEVPKHTSSIVYIDILILADEPIALELKYHKGNLKTQIDGEDFDLRGTAPRDVARYGFLKDIERLESFVRNPAITSGFALLLTNDPLMWLGGENSGSIDEQFALWAGRNLHGHLKWADHASPGSVAGRADGVQIGGTYSCTWNRYAVVPNAKHGEFRYLLVEATG
jgi:hypothetical protein